MRLTEIGSDYIEIDEQKILNEDLLKIPRVHIIKLSFLSPSSNKINSVFNMFSRTMRFVIEDNIKIYNHLLKKTSKKYYVENMPGQGLISFMRRNNKVLLNISRFSEGEEDFILNYLGDVLRNVEVIKIRKDAYTEHKAILNKWNGNVILGK